jgi:putative ABC transport system permease protein
MRGMLSDIRYALRVMARNRLFTAVVVAVLAAGIGANTAIFSVIDALMLSPLPFPHGDRLAFIWETSPRSSTRIGPSGPNYLDFKEQSGSFDDIAALEPGSATVTGFGEPAQVAALRVTTNYLRVLGITPALGRDFTVGEAWQNRVVIISYGFWQRNLGLASAPIGRVVVLDNLPYTIIGVTPRTFWSPVPSELLVPWSEADLRARSRTGHDFGVIGRLKRNVIAEQATAELTVIEQRIALAAPQMKDWAVTVVPLRRLLSEHLGASMTALLAAVGLLLLIACANIATLLLARAASRARDTSVRRALGASRRQLMRQFLTESMLLALLGGAAGLLIAWWGVTILDGILPTTLPVTDGGVLTRPPVALDGTVLAFTMLISVGTGVVFGVAPALASGRTDVNASLNEGGRNVARGQSRLRNMLIVTEVSLAFVLVTCAALTVRSFWRLAHVDPGFVPDRLLALEMELPTDTRYTDAAQQRAFYSLVLAKAASVPGVQHAAIATILPLDPTHADSQTFDIPGQPAAPGEAPRTAARRSVSSDYFQAMAIPLRRGRTFDQHDREGRPPVVIIDDTFGRRYFGGADPVGRRLRIGRSDLEIVGVVGAVKQEGLDRPSSPTVYLSLLQAPDPLASLVVRTTVDPGAMVSAVKSAVYAVDAAQPVYRIRTMAQAHADITSPQRITVILLTLFAAGALALATIGIYGLIAFTVAERRRELGIRIALGAAPGQIAELLVGHGTRVTLIGVGVGAVFAVAATRLLGSILYGVDARHPDAMLFAGAAAAIIGVAMLASYAPARRATKIDPIASLRAE